MDSFKIRCHDKQKYEANRQNFKICHLKPAYLLTNTEIFRIL